MLGGHPKVGIRAKSIALLCLCALVPLIVVSIACYISAKSALESIIRAELAQQTNRTIVELERSLATASTNLRTWSDLRVMQDVLIDDVEQEITIELKELSQQYRRFGAIVVANSDGVIVAATNQSLFGQRIADTDLFAATSAGKDFQGSVAHSDLANRTALTLALPIRASYDDDTIIGTLIGTIDWAKIQVGLADVLLSGSHQDNNHLLFLVGQQDGSILYQTETAATSALLNLEALDPISADHGDYLVSVAYSQGQGSFANPQWQVYAATSTEVAFAPVHRLRNQTVIVGLVVCALAFAIGWFGGGSLVRPLTAMIIVMRSLAQGVNEIAIPALQRQDEIGEMAGALKVFQATAIDRARKHEALIKAKQAAETAEQHVRHLAEHDVLTGLANRRLFAERLEQAMAMAKCDSRKVAVLFLDLDEFKVVNDTLGHPAGDQLLCQVAERLKSHLRDVDTLARMGGDEFAIVQVGIEVPADVAPLCERLAAAVTQSANLDGIDVQVSVSIGIALYPDDAETVTELIKKADMALYGTKGERRGTYRFFEPAMEADIRERKRLEEELQAALEQQEFQLEYQPQVRIADRRIVGVEALLRWRHPTRGQVAPDLFIPLAEETGLIQPIGAWVLETAAAQAAAWRAITGVGIQVSVNLSPVQFRLGNIGKMVEQALADADLPAHLLQMEITEQTALQDDNATLDALRLIKELGVHLSMDDFGTGYSSMSTLRSFPFDEIKIDQSFVRDLDHDPQAMAIVRATISLAQNLGMLTVAEGIETADQLDFLAAEGCVVAQGYYFARPLPAAEITCLLQSALVHTVPIDGVEGAAFSDAC